MGSQIGTAKWLKALLKLKHSKAKQKARKSEKSGQALHKEKSDTATFTEAELKKYFDSAIKYNYSAKKGIKSELY